MNPRIYLSKSVLLFILGIILCHLLSASEQTLVTSYFHCALCFGLLIGVAAYMFLKKPQSALLFLVLFILKQVIGIIHYHYFIDPLYFTGSGELPASIWREQQSVFFAIEHLSDMKDSGTIIPYLPRNMLAVSHPELMTFISLPLHYFGVHALNFLPLNSFFALFTAINFKIISRYYRLDKRQTAFVFWIIVLFPTFLFDDHVWRDVIGVSLIVWSITGYILSGRQASFLKCLFFMLLICTSYMHRTVYAFVALGAFCIAYVLQLKDYRTKITLSLLIAIVLIFWFRFVISFEDEEYLSKFVNTRSLLALPVKIFVGLIGPFPWSQIVNYEISPELGYQLGNYIMGVMLLAFMIYAIRFRIWHNKVPMRFMEFYSLGLLVAAFVATFLDQNYVAQGFIFLLPWLAPQIHLKKFARTLMLSLLILFILNLIVSQIGGIGISSLWLS